LELDHVNEDKSEGGSCSIVEPECPVPIKINTDILVENDSLSLLSETAFVDTVLTSLPVGCFFIGLGFVKNCFIVSYLFLFGLLCRFCLKRNNMFLQLLRHILLGYMVRCFSFQP